MSNPIEIRGNIAVRNLRQAKLSNGRPFMINSKDLPAHQCYLEYPGGKISLMTLAPNDVTWDIPKSFREAGYKVNMIFPGLDNPDLSELRVIDQTMEGGHYVPRNVIEDNFYGNLEKLNQHYKVLDTPEIIETSESNHILLAQLKNDKIVYSLPQINYRNGLPNISLIGLPSLKKLFLDGSSL